MPPFLLTLLGVARRPAVVMSLVGVAAFVMILVYKNMEIHGLRHDVASWQDRYNQKYTDLMITQVNNSHLQQSLRDQNAAISNLGAKQDAANAKWASAQASLKALNLSLTGRLKLIDATTAGPDKCVSAALVLKEGANGH